MTTIKSRLLPTGGLILGLALLVAVPLAGRELRSAVSDAQSRRQGAATAPAQPQTPPATTAAPRPGDPQGAGPSRPGARPEWLWWKDADIQKSLGLTDAKVKNISHIWDTRARQTQPLRDKFEKELAVLDQMAAEQKVSVDEFALQVTAVAALQTKLWESRQIMNYRIRRELTPEQYKKLEEIRDKRFNSGRGRGSGLHR